QAQIDQPTHLRAERAVHVAVPRGPSATGRAGHHRVRSYWSATNAVNSATSRALPPHLSFTQPDPSRKGSVGILAFSRRPPPGEQTAWTGFSLAPHARPGSSCRR